MLKLDCDEGTKRYFKKFFIRSIRNKVLQKSVLIYYNFFYQRNDKIKLGGLPWNRTNVAWSLEPKDVMEIIHCSERTAKEYVDFFKCIYR